MVFDARRCWSALLSLTLSGCYSSGPSSPDGPADSAPTDVAADAAPPDLPLDLAPDCPALALGDAQQASGWRVVQIADAPLRDVACLQGYVFAAGDRGTMLRREPDLQACGSFVPQIVPTDVDLLTVAFADLRYGATAGRGPEIWRTLDHGETWEKAPQCGGVEFAAFHSFHMHSITQGYGAGEAADQGGAAYKVFAGSTWICPEQTFTEPVFYGTFRSVNDGWFVGDTGGWIYKTTDEGFTWFHCETGVTRPLRAVHFARQAGTLVGVAAGDQGAIVRSDDGLGLAWSPVSAMVNEDLRDVFLLADGRGWIVGDNGTILYTTDRGVTWSYQLVPVVERLEAVCFDSPDEGWIVGDDGSILHTVTGGRPPE